MKNHVDVIIIGAGAAGLAAAAQLRKAKIGFRVLEARPRIGGRAHTLLGEVPVEMGPEFIHGNAPASHCLLEQAKLSYFDVPDHHFVKEGKRLVDAGDFWSDLIKVFDKIPHISKDISMEKALSLTRGISSEKKSVMRSFIQGFDASLINEVSAKEMISAKSQVEDEDERRVGRTLNGYSVLLNFLASAFESQISLECEVVSVEWKNNHVKVQYKKNGSQTIQVLTAKKLLLTVPVGVLKSTPMERGHIRFEPPLYEKARALDGIQMGPVLKIVLQFKRDFWSEKFKTPVSMIHTPKKKFQTWWSTAPMHWPLFTAWSGGDPVLSLMSMKESELNKLVLKEFSDVVGISKRRVQSELDKIHYHDWSKDPYSRGAYSFVRVDGSGARKALAKPLKKTLFFAGEATHEERNGTVDGAMETGARAALQILRSF